MKNDLNLMNFFYSMGLMGMALALICSLLACANIFKTEPSSSASKDFKAKIAPIKQTRPIPVEIAQDIAEISENGTIRYREDTIQLEERVDSLEGKIARKPDSSTLKLDLSDPSGQTEKLPNPETNNVISRQPNPGPLGQALNRKPNKLKPGPLKIRSRLVLNSQASDGKFAHHYLVRLGDTLMKIAFDVYGNFLRWREIYRDNRHKMKHYRKMPVGTLLGIRNTNSISIRKSGKAYVIQHQDSLQKIAKKLYGTSSKWHLLWKNNPQLIKNPRRIYAGFTLYFEADTRKPVAQNSADRHLTNEQPSLPLKQ